MLYASIILAILSAVSEVVAGKVKPTARGLKYENQNITNAIDNLLIGYDNRLRPYFGGIPLNISVYITVVSISNVKEKDMEFSLDLFFKQAWSDPRLKHNIGFPLILPGNLKQKIWIPDTFILNVKTARFHQVPASNVRIVIEPNGNIELSERLTITASCRMDLRRYPLDTQTCVLEILSYSFDVNDIDYYWKPKVDVIVLDPEMSEFELSDYKGERKQVKYVIGTYTHLVAKFVFRRRLAYSFIQIYSPTFLIVVLSWLSFWISKDAVPARIALGITTVLTIVTLMGSLRNTVPKVSYIKAIDSYLIVSFIFVFGTLLEYIAVLMHSQKLKFRKLRGKKIKSRAQLDLEDLTGTTPYRPVIGSSSSRNSVRYSYNEHSPMPTSRIHLTPPPPPPPQPQRPPPQPQRPPPQTCLRRGLIPGPAISHSPYAATPPRSRIIDWLRELRLPMLPRLPCFYTEDKEVDLFDRLARVFFPFSFMVFNVGYYFYYT